MNYTNANIWSAFKQTGAPTNLKLSLEFTELSLQSRNRLMQIDGESVETESINTEYTYDSFVPAEGQEYEIQQPMDGGGVWTPPNSSDSSNNNSYDDFRAGGYF